MSDKLKANSLSFFESIIMGVAGSAPGFSIAVAISGLLATAGFFSPNAVLIFALPMLGIALAYKGLNLKFANAGAAYEWTKIGFGRLFGYFSGWALLVASMVFMVTGVCLAVPAQLPASTGDVPAIRCRAGGQRNRAARARDLRALDLQHRYPDRRHRRPARRSAVLPPGRLSPHPRGGFTVLTQAPIPAPGTAA
ncbi:MAG TPA: hypothetical protein VND24_00965 [Steroidobacteraceae bacterium]|nr:hypothetical protein [Steroidobacteraceae bacterium]